MSDKEETLSETQTESNETTYEQTRLHEFCQKIKWFPEGRAQFKQNLVTIIHTMVLVLSTITGILFMVTGDQLLSVIPTAIASKVIMHYVPLDVDKLLKE